MYSALYFTDLHFGPNLTYRDSTKPAHIPPPPPTYGAQAHGLVSNLLAYGEYNGLPTIIHGGDENTLGADNFEENFAKTESLLNSYAGHMIRVSGNHDPRPQTKDTPCGIISESHTMRVHDNVSVIVLQPKLYPHTDNPGQWIYHYDEADDALVEETLAKRPDDFIILASHWALDRLHRGYPTLYNLSKRYGYEVRTDTILQKLSERTPGSVINVAGHEHRFSCSDASGIQTLIMPAFTQADVDTENRACGLFAALHIKKNDGKLSCSIDYHKASSPNGQKVNAYYMRRYTRSLEPA